MHLRRVGIAALLLAGCVGAWLALRLVRSSGDEERGRFERGETCLVVSNLAGSSIWLQPGNYYLRATDNDGTFLVAIRPFS